MRAASLVALTIAVGCSHDVDRGSDRAPIVNGTDDDDDEGVVALLAAGSVYCTGTLISERVVLTAGHCIDSVLPQKVFFGADVAAGGTELDVIDRRVHPEFEPLDFTNDVGMVLLAEPAPSSATPWPLYTAPLTAADVGRAIRLVGFGDTGGMANDSGRKRQGTSVIDEIDETTFRFGPNPSQTCVGDSGGPAFIDDGGTERIVGVTSTGDPACALFARDRRVDVYAAFIQSYVDETRAGAAAVGERCYFEGNCARGTCFQPTDGFAYCTDSCSSDDQCEGGTRCSDDGQCRHALAPGAQGATCADDNGCSSLLCARPECSDTAVCTTICASDDDCAEGSSCGAAEGMSLTACFRSEDGGCAATSSPAAPVVVVLVLVALASGRRRNAT